MDGRQHEEAHQDQGRGGGGARNHGEKGREKQGDKEQRGHGECRQAGPSTLGDTRGAFHIGGHRAGAHHGAEGGADGITEEGRFGAGDIALVVEHSGLGGDAHQGTDGVEQVHEQKGQEHDGHVHGEDLGKVELPEDGRQGRWGADGCAVGKGGDTGGNAEDGRGKNTDQQGALYPGGQKRPGNDDADKGDERGGGDVAETHQDGVVVDDDPGVLQADEGDKETDAGGNGMFHGQRDGVYDEFPDIQDGENEEDDPLEENGGEGELPAVPHAEDHGEGKKGIQAHARGQGEGEPGEEPHGQGGHSTRERGCREEGILVHARGAQYAGVYGKNIGHGHEGGDTGDDLGLYIGVVFLETKELVHDGSRMGLRIVCSSEASLRADEA